MSKTPLFGTPRYIPIHVPKKQAVLGPYCKVMAIFGISHTKQTQTHSKNEFRTPGGVRGGQGGSDCADFSLKKGGWFKSDEEGG